MTRKDLSVILPVGDGKEAKTHRIWVIVQTSSFFCPILLHRQLSTSASMKASINFVYYLMEKVNEYIDEKWDENG